MPICTYNALSGDPTKTKYIRERLVGELKTRFASINAKSKTKIVDEDFFRLGTRKPIQLAEEDNWFWRDEVNDYMLWWEDVAEEELMEPQSTEQTQFPFWLALFLSAGYSQGIERAQSELRRIGINVLEGESHVPSRMRHPEHIERFSRLVNRGREGMEKIKGNLKAVVRNTISDGLLENVGRYALFNEARKATTKIRNKQAITLANTEIVRAHHRANIGEYKLAGIKNVKVLAEWVTAGDGRVCAYCAYMGSLNKLWKLEEIETMIPAHLNCRCLCLPVFNK